MKKIKVGGVEVYKGENPISPITVQNHPWITTEQYTPWIEVQKQVSSGAKVIFYTHLSSAWTGLKDVTGFWFTPTSYTIQIMKSGASMPWSPLLGFWGFDGTSQYAGWTQGTITNTTNTMVARVIDNPWSTRTQFVHSSFISWGIKLNCTASWYDVIMMITAYK